MTLFAEGDSATVKLSADSVFKKQPKPPGFKGKYLVYDIKIVKVIAKGKETEPIFQAAVTKYMESVANAEKTAEPAKIKNYIADKKLTVNKTDSGLYYVITKPGVGANVVNGDTALVVYTGSLLSGKVFDTSIKEVAVKAKLGSLDQRPYTPIKVVIGQKKVVAGWEQGLLLLNKGAKATLIIPSKLGWGANGAGPIPPYSPVVFEVELVDIIHPKPGSAPAPVTAQAPLKK
jgi:FKBP-type peptidyl-prolyl cis-trans isomerase FkpA